MGRLVHNIPAAAAYAMAGFFVGYYAMQARRHQKIFYGVLLGCLVFYVVAAQSRAVLIAMGAGWLVLLQYQGHVLSKRTVAGLLSLAIILLLAYPGLLDSFARPMPVRPHLWGYVLEQAKNTPVLGIGVTSSRRIPPTPAIPTAPGGVSHAHSGYLATLRDGGLIGLSLLVVIVARAMRGAWRLNRVGNPLPLATVVYAAVVTLAIRDRLVTNPEELWLYFWIPIALVIVGELRNPPSDQRVGQRRGKIWGSA